MAVRFLFPLAIFIVLAISVSGEVRAQPVHDCTDGCFVMTCDAQNCTLWRCDASGCTAVTTFPREFAVIQGGAEKAGSGSVQSQASAPETLAPGCRSIEACAVKTCDGAECTVWGLSGNTKKMLGIFDDTSGAAQSIVEEFYAPSGVNK